ncbi:hypothetical protein EV356DRAFT_579244 [Viridothelium virens]|uniref:ABM domain-containing protein n=1 Tax=Viridothelium virens TaxID=1048519 RepID=A0A6A6H031_VIRVR|nr:hypothetical protein EV356DRAFT_579244 [Viridothelium virens]
MPNLEVVAIISPKPRKQARVEQLLLEVSAHAKENEPDTLRYQVHRQIKKDTPEFVVIETYTGKAGLEKHASSDIYKRLGKAIQSEDLLVKPLQVVAMHPIGGFASRL